MTFLSQRRWQELLDASATSSNDGRSRRAQKEMRMRASQIANSAHLAGQKEVGGAIARHVHVTAGDSDLIFLVPQLRRMSLQRFDGRVALITGAGRGKRMSAANQKPPRHAPFSLVSVPVGLGREYALLLAKRGAKIVGELYARTQIRENPVFSMHECKSVHSECLQNYKRHWVST